MIPAEILEPVTLCFLIMITIGLSFAILALAGLALVQLFETIDYIKRRIRGYLFTREMKRLSEKHQAEPLAKEEDIA